MQIPKQFVSRRHVLLWLATLPLVGCAPHEIQRSITTANRVIGGDVAGAVTGYIPSTGVAAVDQLVRRQIQTMISEIKKRWGDEKVATEKEYVKYTANYQSRAIISFESGLARVETRQAHDPVAALRQAIIATLLTPEDPTTVDLLSAKEFDTDGEPFLYKLVVDHEKEYIRWQWRAARFADSLLQTSLKTERSHGSITHFVTFNLVREYQTNQQFKYQNFVVQNARRFQQSPALMYAIMEAESSFNPYAMSHVPAYGLMQIVPTTAGRDVHQLLYGREGTPTRDYLFVPENNIRMGAGYLHLLDTRYLRMIENPVSREYCVIAGYNTGSGNVLRAFHQNRDQAVSRANRMAPPDLYRHLLRHLPYQETRNYLPKVVGYKEKYRSVTL
ncbi:murein transglycosylase domain-containing protein [Chrysiogenes arsenatis]|uniref:murein transglycosylase domain-containing protein n=1 Tax=Chrysiogenes arsenatis TaxID=309797 RepID=UPI00041AF71E|nr:murein transglycosylase domain-containing protein [Chrysiogenes arsenatis]